MGGDSSLPLRLVAGKPPAGEIPLRPGVLGKERPRATLIRGPHVVVFGLVALERSLQILLNGNGAHAATTGPALGENHPVERVEDEQANEQIFCDSAEKIERMGAHGKGYGVARVTGANLTCRLRPPSTKGQLSIVSETVPPR